MTSQEEQMLNSLVERVNSTQLSEKDPDAAGLLQCGFSTNPDAVYVLAQSVLVQNIALEQARAQLTQAQQQIEQLQQSHQPAHATSFLGRLLGDKEPGPPAYQPVYSPQGAEYQAPGQPYPNPPYPNAPYQGQPYPNAPYPGQAYPNPPYGGPGYGGPVMGGPFMGQPGGQPSFLRSAAQTAAGVAAGALAFEGVESLLHGGFGHPGMGMGMGGWGMPGIGMGMGPGMFERPMEENVVNNYYDSSGQEHGVEQHFHESGGGGGQLADASWSEPGLDNSGGGSGGFDSGSGYDDSGSSGSFDGGGGSGNDSGGF